MDATRSSLARPWRCDCGIFDEDLNVQHPGENKVYFEFGDYSASDVFFGHRHR